MKDPATKRRGFALLITITLVAFLVLILVGLASFTRVETQVATNTQQVAQARQNALMALNVAIGELQRAAGPDQRVTATADILSEHTDTTKRTHPSKKKWTGVWDTTTNTPAPEWLVSGTTAQRTNVGAAFTDAEVNSGQAVRLVGPKTTDTSTAGNEIIVPLENIQIEEKNIPGFSASSSTLQTVGKYGWWVGDEGVKANLSINDPYAGSADETPYIVAQRVGVERIEGIGYKINGTQVTELITPTLIASPLSKNLLSYVQLSALNNQIDAAALRKNWHDLAPSTQGVLANTRKGGLLLDLSSGLSDANFSGFLQYLRNANVRLTGGEHDAQIFDRKDSSKSWIKDPGGPRWYQFKDYYNLSASASGQFDMLGRRIVSNDLNKTGVPSEGVGDISDSKVNVMPIIAHASVHFRPTVSGTQERLYLYPHVVLWNPYNVTLNITERIPLEIYGMQFKIGSNPSDRIIAELSEAPNAPNAITWSGVETSGTNAPALDSGTKYKVTASGVFTYIRIELMPGASIAPGRSVLYTASATSNNAHRPIPNGSSNMQLVPNGLQGTGFYFPYTFPKAVYAGATGPKTEYFFAMAAADTFMRIYDPVWYRESGYSLGSNNALRYNLGGLNALGTYDSFGNYGGSAHRVTSLPIAPPDNQELNLTNPANQPLAGFRFNLAYQRALGGNYRYSASQARAFFANFNPSAPITNRTHVDRLSGKGYGTNPLYNSGMVDGRPSRTEFEAFRVNMDGLGVAEDNSVSTVGACVLYEIPRSPTEFTSIAQLGGMTYSFNRIDARGNMSSPGGGYLVSNFYPNTMIGNSDAHMLIPESDTSYYMNEFASNETTVYDYNYLINEVLFDNFFFSSIDQSINTTFPLRNSKMVEHVSVFNNTPDGFKDYRKSASKLLSAGAFNVNSTSVEAWKAQLSSLRGLTKYATSDSDEKVPFLRTTRPSLSSYSNANMDSEDPQAYAGFRALTDEEISELATAIVRGIKARVSKKTSPAPFYWLSEFVNRQPNSTESYYKLKGLLQAAIDDVSTTPGKNLINSSFYSDLASYTPLDYKGPQGAYRESVMPAQGSIGSRTINMPLARAAPGFLMQSDLLKRIGASFSTRSDTFVVRAYGSVVNPLTGNEDSKAWVEATVQRVPEYLDSGDLPEERVDELNSTNAKFGRKFIIKSFRWLSTDEI